MSRSLNNVAVPADSGGEIDFRALGSLLKKRRTALILPTLIAFVLVTLGVNMMSPRYTSEAQILLEDQETSFTRTDHGQASDPQTFMDAEGVGSQIELIKSADIARRAIKDLGLAGNSEFDSSARMNPLKAILAAMGLAHDPSNETNDARMVRKFRDALQVFSPPKTRVITLQFTSRDPDLAARATNLIAELYIQAQSAAKRAMAKESAESLANEIADLRTKLSEADAERESFRLKTGLLSGNNNMTITGQQLADINGDLSRARSTQADAQAKASMIRELLKSGKTADVPDVINNDIVRRLWDQRSTAQAQFALESRTLLPGHPRVKELAAQVAEYDQTLRSAAKQAATSLENEAKIAGQRVTNLEAVLTQQKKAVGVSNVDEIHLRSLERTVEGYKDQLESSISKYQAALARQSSDATPADARIISRATPAEEPSFPKKLPFIAVGTVLTALFAGSFIVAREFLSGPTGPLPPVEVRRVAPVEATAASAEPTQRVSKMLQKLQAHRDDDSDVVFAPVEQPAANGGGRQGLVAKAIAYLKGFGLSAEASRAAFAADAAIPEKGFDWADPSEKAPTEVGQTHTSPIDVKAQIDQIVAAHVPGRGLHVVGTSLGNEPGSNAVLIGLSRRLSEKGRSILVDLNRTPTKLADLCDGDGASNILTMKGLSELLAGDASFAEVIHRDHASRLHFVPAGRQEADFRDFDLILDALSETYDFVVLLTPAFPQSEIAKVMAPYADFVVLTTSSGTDAKMVAMMEKHLIEAGARNILVAGRLDDVSAQGVA